MVPSIGSNAPMFLDKGTVIIHEIETIRCRVGCPEKGVLTGSTLAKVWVQRFAPGLKVRATPTREGELSTGYAKPRSSYGRDLFMLCLGITELACGSQAFIATLLFDPSMSALPIIPKQNSVSVGLFTH